MDLQSHNSIPSFIRILFIRIMPALCEKIAYGTSWYNILTDFKMYIQKVWQHSISFVQMLSLYRIVFVAIVLINSLCAYSFFELLFFLRANPFRVRKRKNQPFDALRVSTWISKTNFLAFSWTILLRPSNLLFVVPCISPTNRLLFLGTMG